MKKLLFLLLAVVFFAGDASAQQTTACPVNVWFAYGYTLSPGQWQACWNSKQNLIGYVPLNKAGDSMAGELVASPSSTANSGFNLGPGSAPSSPANGDLWVTSSGLYIRVAGVTIGPLGSGSTGTQTAHAVFAGPTTGSAAVPTWRALVAADLPTMTATVGGAVPTPPNDVTKFLNGTGAFSVPSGSSAANPTATAGPVAVNGSAATFMRSDAAPAVQLATSSQSGLVQPDNTSIIASGGVISAVSLPVGSMINATMSVTTAAASAVFSADGITVATTLGGATYRLASYSQTINLATIGAGGMDTGTAPASSFVALYAIYKPATTTASILATTAAVSAPTIYGGANMPVGYTASALIGVWPTNSSSQFVAGYQEDRAVSFVPVQALSIAPGSVPTSYTPVSISSVVPPAARWWGGSGGTPTASSGLFFAVAASSSGIGEIDVGGIVSSGSAINGFYAATAVPRIPIVSGPQFFYKSASASWGAMIDISSYGF